MSGTSFMTYIISIHRARGDVRDNYAENFLQFEKQNGFLQSRYMKYLINKYMIACKKQIAKNRVIPRVYAQIIHAYEVSHTYCKTIDNQVLEMQARVDGMKSRITEQKEFLERLNKDRTMADDTGKLPDGCPARSFGELAQMIADQEKSIQNLYAEKAKARSAINAKKELIDQKKKEALPYIIDTIIDFERRIEALFLQIDLIGENYDRVFQSCSYFLQRRIKDFKVKGEYIRVMGKYPDFLAVCVKCGCELMAEENLYQKEREFIDTEIRSFFDIRKRDRQGK